MFHFPRLSSFPTFPTFFPSLNLFFHFLPRSFAGERGKNFRATELGWVYCCMIQFLPSCFFYFGVFVTSAPHSSCIVLYLCACFCFVLFFCVCDVSWKLVSSAEMLQESTRNKISIFCHVPVRCLLQYVFTRVYYHDIYSCLCVCFVFVFQDGTKHLYWYFCR